jgi:hypothetical protein
LRSESYYYDKKLIDCRIVLNIQIGILTLPKD